MNRVIGAGYVGLISAVCLAERGHATACVDVVPADLVALLTRPVGNGTPGSY